MNRKCIYANDEDERFAVVVAGKMIWEYDIKVYL